MPNEHALAIDMDGGALTSMLTISASAVPGTLLCSHCLNFALADLILTTLARVVVFSLVRFVVAFGFLFVLISPLC